MASVLTDNAVVDDDRHELPPSMVDRMTLIMDTFGGPQTRLTLEDVASRTNLPRSTTHRILEKLVRLGWLDRNGREYALGPRALGLGGREVGHSALRTAAFPLLHALAMRTELVAHLAVLDGGEVYYLDKVGGKAAMRVPSMVGGRAPAHCTAVGKAMLAWLSPEEVDARYEQGLTRRTVRSIGDIGVLHQELNRIRARNGLAFECGECDHAIACVGAAVRGPDGPIGGISLVGDARVALERLAPLVVNTAHVISEKLSGDYGQRPRPHPDSVVLRDMPQAPSLSEALGRLVAMGERGEWF
ncbi:IclR family transcriptional regulator [Nocardia jiangxiensis]|uniref:IclR family transcriptional regulator n=1 Tax=Nocardia jiangxiensis TaxID=282685 RepID=A0ABW6RU00_9NOCA|nr:IclR family transcriptional regulator [Nocardia jiangxiensis]